MTERPRAPVTRTPGPAGGDDPNIIDLVSHLTQQGAHLAKEQVCLMQAEVRVAADDIKSAVAALAAGVVFGVAGLGVLLMGIAYLVGDALENLALGTIFTGAATLVVAGILYASGKNKVSTTNLTPDRTIASFADDADAVARALPTSGEHHDR
jgi:hypothetical protein